MENNKKNNLSEEHLRKIKHRFDYQINESPKYRPLINANEEYDEVPAYNTLDGQPVPKSPSFTNEVGDQEDVPQEKEPIEPSNDETVGMNVGTDAPKPAFDKAGVGELPLEPPMETPENPENEVNDIQNEIIKHNIEAMKSIHDQLEGLNGMVQGLNSKLDTLSNDVEEVREPTNSEKLMSKTNVSYPYYFNLNSFWSGNWFNEKRNQEMEKGIKEMPDGTFVADFDDLPQMSKTDVQNSFSDI